MNKKGISGVITTVLLILIVLAAIGIVWAVVNSFIQEGTSGIEGTASCLSMQLQIDSAVYDGAGTNISVKRIAGEGSLESIAFIVDGSIAEFTALSGLPDIAETKRFSNTGLGNTTGLEVEIVPVVGGKQCSVVDSEIIKHT